MSNFAIETSAPENRVIRVTNLDTKATVDQLKQLFSDYNPISASRGKNPKNKKYDVGYVFFATEADRIAAQSLSLSDTGRQLRVFPAKTGFFFVGDQIWANGEKPPLESALRGKITAKNKNSSRAAETPKKPVGTPTEYMGTPTKTPIKTPQKSPAKPVVTDEEWDNFQANERAKIEREFDERGRNVDKIMRQGEHEEDE